MNIPLVESPYAALTPEPTNHHEHEHHEHEQHHVHNFAVRGAGQRLLLVPRCLGGGVQYGLQHSRARLRFGDGLLRWYGWQRRELPDGAECAARARPDVRRGWRVRGGPRLFRRNTRRSLHGHPDQCERLGHKHPARVRLPVDTSEVLLGECEIEP